MNGFLWLVGWCSRGIPIQCTDCCVALPARLVLGGQADGCTEDGAESDRVHICILRDSVVRRISKHVSSNCLRLQLT